MERYDEVGIKSRLLDCVGTVSSYTYANLHEQLSLIPNYFVVGIKRLTIYHNITKAIGSPLERNTPEISSSLPKGLLSSSREERQV